MAKKYPKLVSELLKDDVMRKALRVALECGYRSIDTAYRYNNEEAIGDELHEWLTSGKLKRDELFVTSKLPFYGNRLNDVTRFLKISLKRLKLDYLDLFLIHHPFGFQDLEGKDIICVEDLVLDFETNLEELWRGMEEQVTAGRVKSIGISNFNAEQMERIMKIAKIPPAVNQVEIHCYLQQRALTEKCNELGIAVQAYAPLGAPYMSDPNDKTPVVLEHPTVLEIAKRHGKTSAQIILNFLLSQGIIILPKSVTPERIKTNFEVFGFTLSHEETNSLKALDKGEIGRIFHFRNLYPGCEKHKEYPFSKP